jgi:hypothetical protein
MIMANPVCYEREVTNRKRLHRRALRKMKPTSQLHTRAALDFNAPATMNLKHVWLKTNRRHAEDQEQARIERENRQLVEKMDVIMHPGPGSGRQQVPFAPGLTLDRALRPSVDCRQRAHRMGTRGAFKYAGAGTDQTTLNGEAREREYERVTRENAKMLARMVRRHPDPACDRRAQARDREQSMVYARIASKDLTVGHLPSSRSYSDSAGGWGGSSMGLSGGGSRFGLGSSRPRSRAGRGNGGGGGGGSAVMRPSTAGARGDARQQGGNRGQRPGTAGSARRRRQAAGGLGDGGWQPPPPSQPRRGGWDEEEDAVTHEWGEDKEDAQELRGGRAGAGGGGQQEGFGGAGAGTARRLLLDVGAART